MPSLSHFLADGAINVPLPTAAAASPLRILTWQSRAGYLHGLSQLPHRFHIMTKPGHPAGDGGRCDCWPRGDNVHEIPAEQARHAEFDCILFHEHVHYLEDQYLYLTPAQRCLPRIFLEHDQPDGYRIDARHPVDDPDVLLVHVTAFNELMWDNGSQTTRVIEQGSMALPDIEYSGERACGAVVVAGQGAQRRLGSDICQRLHPQVPLELAPVPPSSCGPHCRCAPTRLPASVAQCRFLFHPARSGGIDRGIIDAMLIGMPVIALATGEMASLIQNGISGYIDTDIRRLARHMQELLDDPHYAFVLGRGARRRARERFGMHRFLADWQAALHWATQRQSAT